MEVFVRDGKLEYCDHCFQGRIHIVLDWEQKGITENADPEAIKRWAMDKFKELLTESPY